MARKSKLTPQQVSDQIAAMSALYRPKPVTPVKPAPPKPTGKGRDS